jgi:hypothetical protein
MNHGYTITIDKLLTEPAKGQWRAAINGKTVAVSRSKRAALANAEFLANRLTPATFAALVSPIEEEAA